MKMILKIVSLVFMTVMVRADLGIDFQTQAEVAHFQCLIKGYKIVTFRAWEANNTLNPFVRNNIVNAVSAGYQKDQIQLYMIPCGTQTAQS